MRWLRRCHGYQEFFNVSIGSGVARRDPVDRAGSFNQRIAFLNTLEEVRKAGELLLAAMAGENLSTRKISKEIKDFWRRYGVAGD